MRDLSLPRRSSLRVSLELFRPYITHDLVVLGNISLLFWVRNRPLNYGSPVTDTLHFLTIGNVPWSHHIPVLRPIKRVLTGFPEVTDTLLFSGLAVGMQEDLPKASFCLDMYRWNSYHIYNTYACRLWMYRSAPYCRFWTSYMSIPIAGNLTRYSSVFGTPQKNNCSTGTILRSLESLAEKATVLPYCSSFHQLHDKRRNFDTNHCLYTKGAADNSFRSRWIHARPLRLYLEN